MYFFNSQTFLVRIPKLFALLLCVINIRMLYMQKIVELKKKLQVEKSKI